MDDQRIVTPPKTVKTSIPFPYRKASHDQLSGTVTEEIAASPDDTIHVHISSELMDHYAPLQYFQPQPNERLKLVHTPDGHPIVFALSSERVSFIIPVLPGQC
jgi:hypothetical protein